MKKIFLSLFIISFVVTPAVSHAGFFDFFRGGKLELGAQAKTALDGSSDDVTYKKGDKNLDILEIQIMLQKLGLYDGDLSGLIGPKTEAAIKAYQASHKLPATGELDSVTFAMILGKEVKENVRDDRGGGGVTADIKMFLGGAYNPATGLMSTALNDAGLIPEVEPYSDLNIPMEGGGDEEVTDMTVFDVNGSNAIVDWVIVEVRNGTNMFDIEHSRAALIQADGDIVDVDGISPVSLPVAPGNYYVSVLHRNHLQAITENPVSLLGEVDMTQLPLYGTNPAKLVNGIQMLWPGDVNADQTVLYTGFGNDRDLILVALNANPNSTIAGYRSEDVTMDGITKYTGTGNDRDIILQTVGGITPNNEVIAQLPELTSCLMAELVSTDATAQQGEPGFSDVGAYTITFEVTAMCDGNTYISKESSQDEGNDTPDQGTTFGVTVSNQNVAMTAPSALICNDCSDENETSYILDEGDTQTFNLHVSVSPTTGDMFAKVYLDSINWSGTLGPATQFYDLNTGPGSDFETDNLFLQDAN